MNPIVPMHANAQLTASGTTSHVLADFRQPEVGGPPGNSRADRLRPAGRPRPGREPAITDEQVEEAVVAT
jgi:hypothetical protein